MVDISDARPDTCFGKIKLGMFVGYGWGWQDGARNRLAAASKGRVHAWLDITRVAWGGQAPPSQNVPDHVPSSDLTIRDHVLFPRRIVLVESEDTHSMSAVPQHVAEKYMLYFQSQDYTFRGVAKIHCCKYVANSERLQHCKWCQSQTDFMGGILGLASHCPGLPKTFKNPPIVQGLPKTFKNATLQDAAH